MTAFTDILQKIEGGESGPASATPRKPPVPQWEGWIAAILGAPPAARAEKASKTFTAHPTAQPKAHPTLPHHAGASAPKPKGAETPPPPPPLDLDRELSSARLKRLTSVELMSLRRKLALQLHPDISNGQAAVGADDMARVNSVIDAEIKSRRPPTR